jgi:hypothetical protein
MLLGCSESIANHLLKYCPFTNGFGMSDKPDERLRRRQASYDRERRVRLKVG